MKKIILIFCIYFLNINLVLANTNIDFIDMDKVKRD